LNSHIDITIPAADAPCRVILTDGQGQELVSAASPGAVTSSNATYNQQQQQGSTLAAALRATDGAARSWQQMGVVPDQLYVVKEANASGLASLHLGITSAMKAAWVKHYKDAQQVNAACRCIHRDGAVSLRNQSPASACVTV
jgi:uridine phosphorylase